MTPDIPESVEASLAAQLAAGVPGPFAVMVLFNRDLPPSELAGLGLEGSSALGFGRLERGPLLSLARRQDVQRIELREGPTRPSPPKLSTALAQELASAPGQAHYIYVTFSALPNRAELERLSLSSEATPAAGVAAAPQHAVAHGLLTEQQTAALAARDDVLFLDVGSAYYLA